MEAWRLVGSTLTTIVPCGVAFERVSSAGKKDSSALRLKWNQKPKMPQKAATRTAPEAPAWEGEWLVRSECGMRGQPVQTISPALGAETSVKHVQEVPPPSRKLESWSDVFFCCSSWNLRITSPRPRGDPGREGAARAARVRGAGDSGGGSSGGSCPGGWTP